MAGLTVSGDRAAPTIELAITFSRVFRVRWRASLILMRLAAWCYPGDATVKIIGRSEG